MLCHACRTCVETLFFWEPLCLLLVTGLAVTEAHEDGYPQDEPSAGQELREEDEERGEVSPRDQGDRQNRRDQRAAEPVSEVLGVVHQQGRLYHLLPLLLVRQDQRRRHARFVFLPAETHVL